MTLNRFEQKFNKTDGCWIWNAATDRKGYGAFSYNGKRATASRVSYLLYNGPIEDGLHVLHKCDNPTCVNPAHLFLGTNTDNVNDRISKDRPVGRPKSLDDERLKYLQEIIGQQDMSYREISRVTGIDRSTVRRVANNTY